MPHSIKALYSPQSFNSFISLPLLSFSSQQRVTEPHLTAMPFCGPAFTVPSCSSAPVVGFGSAGLGYGSLGGIGHGYGYGALVGSGVPSASLGTLSGVEPSCINQIPPAEVVLQPPASVVTLPGPILSATGLPVKVGGNTPCAVSYGGFRRGSFGALGGHLGSDFGQRGNLILGRRGSNCYSPI